jgi:hypothetical protein
LQALTALKDDSALLGDAGVLEEPTGGGNTVASPAGGQVTARAEEDQQHDEDRRDGTRKRKHRGHGDNR